VAIPERIQPQSLADYLEIMTRAVFQAGVSWKLVESKWDAFREVFANFDPERVALFEAKDVDALMQDSRILRSQKKIEGTIKNARTILDLEREFGGFQNYLRSKSSYEQLSADIRKRFKYVGELSVYYILFRVNEKVPPFEEWITTIEGDHPRMKEMIDLARTKDPSAAR
jgi:3-methyladenine DNA glycosylase Tag